MSAAGTIRQLKHSLPWKKAKQNTRPTRSRRPTPSYRYTRGQAISSRPEDDGCFEVPVSPGSDNQAYYFFSDDEDNGEDDDGDRILFKMSELRPRSGRVSTTSDPAQRSGSTSTSTPRAPLPDDNIQLVERQILPGESLQSFALQYGCAVGLLRRVNRLVSDQDFYAMTHIKLPIKKYSLLTEIQHEIRQRPQLASQLELPPDGSLPPSSGVRGSEVDDDDDVGVELRTVGITNCLEDKDAAFFLGAMDRDLARIRRSTSSYKNSLEEVAHSLTSRRFFPLRATAPGAECDRADCGLKWWHPVAVMIVICVISPLVYYFLLMYGRADNSWSGAGD